MVSVHSSIDEHLGCFLSLEGANLQNIAMNMYVNIFAWMYISLILGIDLGVSDHLLIKECHLIY